MIALKRRESISRQLLIKFKELRESGLNSKLSGNKIVYINNPILANQDESLQQMDTPQFDRKRKPLLV